MEENYVFQDKAPYPPITVCAKNIEYAAAMVSNIGACNSEMSAVSLYFYNSVITKEAFGEVSVCFHKISVVEMQHLNIFSQLTLKLGMDPRLWQRKNGKMEYWSPDCNRYPDRILLLLENALRGELDTIEKYRQQAEWIKDENIAAILKRIIIDEDLHVEIFRDLYRKISGRDCMVGNKR